MENYHLYVDFKKAYDSIDRIKLFQTLVEFEVPAKLINLIKIAVNNIRLSVKVQKSISLV